MAVELKRVLISDSVDASCREILEAAGISVDYKPGLSKTELLSVIKDYHGLVVRSRTKVTQEVIEAGVPQLKLIGRAGTGVDNIDLNAATKNGVIVMNTPGGNTISAAEHTCTMICSVARNVPQGYASLMAGKWDRKAFMGVELEGRTLGIVGLGRIGREVAKRMQSFGMKTVGYDPLVSAEEAATFNVEFLELEDMWPLVDFITVHTPLIPQTRGLINDEVFSKCRKGIRVVNVARGGIIDEAALLRALESGQCGGAGLDVFIEEPPTNRALVEHPHVVGTPHLGASTVEAQLKVAQEIAQQFVAAAKGEGLVGVVNVPRLTSVMVPATEPWIHLVVGLSRILRASTNTSPSHVTLTLSGQSLKKLGDLLSSAVLVGLSTTNHINLVNAKTKAGAKVEVVVDPEGTEGIKLECAGGLSVAGTVNGGVPVLCSLAETECTSLVSMCGNLVITRGCGLADVVQALQGVSMVCSCGDYVVAKVTTLPTQPVEGGVASVSL